MYLSDLHADTLRLLPVKIIQGGYKSDGAIGLFFNTVAIQINVHNEALMDHETPVGLLRLTETPVVLRQEQPEGEQLE